MTDSGRCSRRYTELISQYIDGELSADERQELLRHLATCADCRRVLELYRRIGGQIRSLPPVQPPPQLRNAIFAQTIDTGPKRLYVLTSRVGYSLAAVAAIFLVFVVAIYLIVGGYQRSIDPEVVASAPRDGEFWSLVRPIEITFNKEMNRESVESALSISPASEKERLSVSWEGNTLVLGENQVLKPGSSYTVSVTQDAKDKWGNPLEEDFSVQFETSETAALFDPPATPEPTATPTPTAEPTSTPVPVSNDAENSNTDTTDPGDQQPVPDASEPDTDGSDSESPVAPPVPTEDDQNDETDDSSGGVPAPPGPPADPVVEPTATPTPLPTATPTPPVAEETPEPTSTPSSTPSPTATEVPPTPVPIPPTATPLPLPTATATPDTVQVDGGFGNVYWGHDVVRSRLGEPVSPAASTSALELDFQQGSMMLRSDTNVIYVIESSGVWNSILNTASNIPEPVPGPIDSTWEPGGTLGFFWQSEQWIQDSLGYALAPQAVSFETRVQEFAGGTMVLSQSGQVHVIYSDLLWELYPG